MHILGIIAFILGFLAATTYKYKVRNFFYHGYHYTIIYLFIKPKMRYMEWYIKRRGWYNPILKSQNPDYPKDWSSPEIWSHDEDKNPPYNELGYGLYAAYMKCKDRDINGKKIIMKTN